MCPRQQFLMPALLIVVMTGVAAAQLSPARYDQQLEQIRRDTRLRAEPSIPAEQRALMDYGGYITIGVMSIDDLESRGHVMMQYDAVGWGRMNIDGAHNFYLRGRTAYRDSVDDDFNGGDEWIEPTLDQGVYRFDLRRVREAYQGRSSEGNLVIEGGRQLVHWANGLVLSQDIDGGLVTVDLPPVELTVLAGLTRNTTLDFDISRPDYNDNTARAIYGGMLAWRVAPALKPYVYGLVQQDHNTDSLTTDFGAGPFTTEFDYNSHYVGAGASGAIGDRLLYGVELVYEGGDTLSNSFDPTSGAGVRQTRDRIQAWAADARVDYLFTDAHRSRIGAEVILASGDSDRLVGNTTLGGNQPGTTDRGFNALGLLNTGLAFAPSLTNLVVVRAGASTFPFPTVGALERLQVGVDLFVFNKLDPDAPIGEPTGHGSYLGFESDFFIAWEIASDVALSARYGVFAPGSTITSTSEPRQFSYLGVTISF